MTATQHPRAGRRTAAARTSLKETVLDAADPMRVMQRIVDESLLLLPSASGAAVVMLNEPELFYACCTGILVGLEGERLSLAGSLSGRAVTTNTVLVSDDTDKDPRVDAEACRRSGSRSIICVPLVDGEVPVGVVLVTSSVPYAFHERDIARIRHLAAFLAVLVRATADLRRVVELAFDVQLDAEFGESDALEISTFVAHVLMPTVAEHSERRERVVDALRRRAFHTVFQPIVELASERVVAVEALTRFTNPQGPSTAAWFEDAREVGLGPALELAVLKTALGSLPSVPEKWRVAVNLGPETIMDDSLVAILRKAGPSRIIVELTEHVEVPDYDELRRRLLDLRDLGVQLAIDDTGAGFASFSHIVKLAPDLIKLDLGLTRGVDVDPIRRSLATAVIAFAGDTGAQVVAEGIETQGELETLTTLGAAYGQGYLLGRPAPIASIEPLAPISRVS